MAGNQSSPVFTSPEEVATDNSSSASESQRNIDADRSQQVDIHAASFGTRPNSGVCNQSPFVSPNNTPSSIPDSGQMVINAIYVLLAIVAEYVSLPFSTPIQETGSNGPSQIVLPRLYSSGRTSECFRDSNRYRSCKAKTVLYSTSEQAGMAMPGRRFCSHVYESICHMFILKMRALNIKVLEKWRLLSASRYVMPLCGVILQDPRNLVIYEVTDRMTGDLLTMRGPITLLKVLQSGNPIHLKNAFSQVKNISFSILTGISDLNKYGLQHYDIKEGNVLVKRPAGCSCPYILTCDHSWEVRIADFDTLDIIQRPFNSVGGTRYHRPPETSAEGDQFYWKPTYDTYSFGVLLLRICCGYPGKDLHDRAQNLPWIAETQDHCCAKDMLIQLDDVCMSIKEMIPRRNIVRLRDIIRRCINDHYEERPTAADVLRDITGFL